MSDSNFIQSIPIILPPSPNGNGQYYAEPLSIENLPDPTTLRQADLHALRLYAIGKAWEHPLINPKLAALLQAKTDIAKLLNMLGPSISAAVFKLDPHNLPPLELTVDDLYQMLGHSADKTLAKQTAMQIISNATRLNITELLDLTEYMHDKVGLTHAFIRKWEQAVKEGRQKLTSQQQAELAIKLKEVLFEKRQAIPSWPYSSLNGQICYNTVDPRGEAVSYPIADFTAEIVKTIQPEHGKSIHHIEGTTFTGKPFELQIDAENFQDIKILTSSFSAAIAHDPRAGIAPGMAQHLPLAIHRLSPSEVKRIHLYNRTGWTQGQFIMPGRALPDVQVDLATDLPYEFKADADLKQGFQALMYLIASVSPRNSLPALMSFFAAPLADKIGLRDEKYVTMIGGRTGKFKTSWTQVGMCLYGPGFAAERSLIKWGDSATTNAMEALASNGHDLPFFVDNYKPNTGEGERGMIKLIHRMAEGGGRRRLDRNATLRPTPDIYSWLIITGEDTPQHDTATSARMLWINFDNQPPDAAKTLALAQNNSEHLCAVGRYWIEWLENKENQATLDTWRQKFPTLRQHYLDLILKINPEAINGNPRRIAQNLAFNRLTWEVLRQSHIGPYINNQKEYTQGLQTILHTMALATVQSNPGIIFIQALRELLSTGRALLIDPNQISIVTASEVASVDNTSGSHSMTTPPPTPGIVGSSDINVGDTARRVIGYIAPDGGAFLFPELARVAVENLLGREALAQATTTTLYKRLDELGYLANKGKDGTLISKKIEGHTKRLLHLSAAALEPMVDPLSTTNDD